MKPLNYQSDIISAWYLTAANVYWRQGLLPGASHPSTYIIGIFAATRDDRRSTNVCRKAFLEDMRPCNLCDHDFDLSRSDKVSCNGVVGVTIHGFPLVYTSNIWLVVHIKSAMKIDFRSDQPSTIKTHLYFFNDYFTILLYWVLLTAMWGNAI